MGQQNNQKNDNGDNELTNKALILLHLLHKVQEKDRHMIVSTNNRRDKNLKKEPT